MTDRVRAVSRRYGSVAREYRSFWAPVMVALSTPLIDALPFVSGQRLVDLGCGVGTIASHLVPRVGSIIGVDAAEGMLRRAPREVSRVAGDLLHLPFAERTFDGALSTFALQHVPFPGTAFGEAARALQPGAFLGTATWGSDHAESGGAYDVLDDVLARHEIPQDPVEVKTWHGRVDSVAKMRAHARKAGLRVQRCWTERQRYEWPREHFFGWATTMGPYGRRLFAAAPQTRERAVGELEAALAALGEEAFVWTPLVVYLIAFNG